MDFEYHVGGFVDIESSTYIERVADENLYDSLSKGHFCYVLTSRQMGKSSMKVRVMEKLRQDGVACGSIDLSFAVDRDNVTAIQWYKRLINVWARELELKSVVDINKFWDEHQESALSERLDEFVNNVIFKYISSPVVFFIDEVDSTINLDFTDDFFAWVRYCFNNRGENTNYKRLSFCFIGVATPLSGAENFLVLDNDCSSKINIQKENIVTFENSTCLSKSSRFLREAQAGRILHHGIGISVGSIKAL